MPDIFGKIVVIILTIVALFIAPLFTMTQKHDSITQGIVYSETADFVDNAREQGRITQEMYLDFMHSLDATGLLYTVEIEHSHQSVVPVFDGENKVIGTDTVESVQYTEQILQIVYAKKTDEVDLATGGTEGMYLMNKGDTISVTVYNREDTLSQKLLSAIFQQHTANKVIYATYGGIVRDENF